MSADSLALPWSDVCVMLNPPAFLKGLDIRPSIFSDRAATLAALGHLGDSKTVSPLRVHRKTRSLRTLSVGWYMSEPACKRIKGPKSTSHNTRPFQPSEAGLGS